MCREIKKVRAALQEGNENDNGGVKMTTAVQFDDGDTIADPKKEVQI